MAVLESKPFLAPSQGSVHAEIEVVSPDAAADEIADVWEAGQRVVLRCRAYLGAEFWEQTAIPQDDEILLVGSISCLSARATWRSSAKFALRDGRWTAETLIEADGGVIAVELLCDVWVIGPARTGSPDPSRAVHPGAKLWQLPRPLKLDLDSQQAAFPTTAIPFAATGRRDVPWVVEMSRDAEPEWSVSSSIRLYVNSDSTLTPSILDGTAAEDIYALIQCDIHFAVFHGLSNWIDAISPSRMAEIADTDHDALAALGASLSRSIGLPLSEALRMAREEPADLMARSREALQFGKAEVTQ